jgi:2-amino-4-hydroxy-6-hydroxymethyldihydropteridine diphosphokinase
MNERADYRVFLGFGGNLGDPRRAFHTARQQLFDHSRISGGRSSSLYQTPALGGPEGQPDYLNAVVEITTSLGPRDLLELCGAIEDRAGRRRSQRWAARTLDLDLLFYADWLIDDPDLQVPHPRITARHFVLLPLVQLAPALIHPRTGLSVRQHLDALGEARDIYQRDTTW